MRTLPMTCSPGLRKLPLLLAGLLLLPCPGRTSETLSFDGYYKNFSVAYFLPRYKNPTDSSNTPPLGSVSNRLRLNSRWRLSDRVQVKVSYDLAPRVQDRLLFDESPVTTATDPLSYRVVDLDARLYPSLNDEVASFAIFQNLDRAFITIRTNRADLYVGRQAIAFGAARVVNPTDIIAPYSYETLDTEDRVGVDAVRVRVPLGFMGEIDAAWVGGDKFESDRSAAFLRTKFYALRTDMALLLLGFRRNLLLGVEAARSLGGAGVWFEAAHVFVDALADEAIPQRDYFRGSLGGDYSFGGNTYVFAEYHFNQAGRDRPGEYLSDSTHAAYTEGSVYLMGRHYLASGMTCQLTPLISGGVELLCNLRDRSAYVVPSIEYNVAEDIYLAGGAYIGIGRRPESAMRMRSEFGSYPDIYFGSFRVYF